MFKNYSSEYTAIIAALVAPLIGTQFSEACSGEISSWVAGTAVALVSSGYLLFKRYSRGDVTKLGVRK